MTILKAIHQIRGVTITKRKSKVEGQQPDIAYPGDTFTTDSSTAKSLVADGNAVEPGQNPMAADQTSRVANVYENLDDEDDDDDEESNSIEQIASRLDESEKAESEKPPVLTPAQKAAATRAAKKAADDKAADTKKDDLGLDDLGLDDDSGEEEKVD